MKKLKIAANTQTLGCFETERDIVDVHHSDCCAPRKMKKRVI
ncbi:hypothetical protein [Serratia marcescens]|nr:hypothetical protein [Serratia marcescens]